MANDSFAQGATSISATSGGSGMTQKQWDAIWLSEDEFQRVYGITKAEFYTKK